MEVPSKNGDALHSLVEPLMRHISTSTKFMMFRKLGVLINTQHLGMFLEKAIRIYSIT
jgi:hypothetical protein